jgi:hypothetical protein
MTDILSIESYIFKDNPIGFLPSELAFLFKTIDKSQYILQLENDWDDAGAEKYEEKTWINAVSFLMRYAKALYEDFNIIINSPKIYHGPKGSIDILWEPSAYRLVINIPKEGDKAMFYADNYGDQTTEGSFHLDNFNVLLIPFATQL